MKYPREIEVSTADHWLAIGTIWITETGSENTYYTDRFGLEYFCKNYPFQREVMEPVIDRLNRLSRKAEKLEADQRAEAWLRGENVSLIQR